jgi:hypothetical protein
VLLNVINLARVKNRAKEGERAIKNENSLLKFLNSSFISRSRGVVDGMFSTYFQLSIHMRRLRDSLMTLSSYSFHRLHE